MKKQSEELFFKYNTIPTQYGGNKASIDINLPSDYSPIAGDIIEMFVSENQNLGFLTYTARLLVYKPLIDDSPDFYYDLVSISGKVASAQNKLEELDNASISGTNGMLRVSLFLPEGKEILFNANATYIVNLIVHRSKASIDLYYL